STVTDIDNGSNDHAAGIAIQSTGQVVVAATSGTSLAVLRYDANGAPVGSPTITSSPGNRLTATAVALDSADDIYVAGQFVDPTGPTGGPSVVRYDSAGSFDSSFGNSGFAV